MSSSVEAYRTPVFIGLLCVMCFAVLLLLHHCVLAACRRNNNQRSRRRHRHHHQQPSSAGGEQQEEEEESVDMSSSSRVHLVKAYGRKVEEEKWSEPTCAVCLADFADGEPVRVLPECMHYYHGDCIDTWLRGSTSCPMCRAETTPTPTPTHSSSADLQHQFSSVSLEEILVRT
ncbi:hypothetical protein EJB05_25672, partial [Eragrostis curvula]